jgi:hypothetical protein
VWLCEPGRSRPLESLSSDVKTDAEAETLFFLQPKQLRLSFADNAQLSPQPLESRYSLASPSFQITELRASVDYGGAKTHPLYAPRPLLGGW